MSEFVDGVPADPLEAYVAGLLSTFPPHNQEHPARCLPMAQAVLAALNEWEPDD